jgi:hypothetical protein
VFDAGSSAQVAVANTNVSSANGEFFMTNGNRTNVGGAG